MSFMLPAYRDANVRWYTELLPDGRTAVRTRYDSPETCLRPVIHTPNDSCDNTVQSPYNPGHSVYVRPDELKIPKQKRTTVTVPRLL